VEFEDKLRSVDLTGKKAAVFGPGESSYPRFCKAVEILEGTLKNCGAELLAGALKVDVLEGDHDNKIKAWSGKIVQVVG